MTAARPVGGFEARKRLKTRRVRRLRAPRVILQRDSSIVEAEVADLAKAGLPEK
jgi:hypothetical protein